MLLVIFALASCGGGSGSGSSQVSAAPTHPNLLGINIGAPLDYSADRIYADMIITSRLFISGVDPNVTTHAPTDTNGWPMSDFSFYVWAGSSNMNGTYSLSFTGQAVVTANGNSPSKVTLSFDPLTNTSTAKIVYTNAAANSFLTLSFVNTKRTIASNTGSGVTLIKLMRPITQGASQSYPTTTIFTQSIKALIAKFSVIRCMDFLATNWNIQTDWVDRPLPTWASFNRNPGGNYGWQGLGGPWEHVILLMNETGKDAWINIPARATDTYIQNVALMFAYGSDGINPYTSRQANPVYPPLNANLKIYIEFSNEVWNSIFSQQIDNCQAASDELVSTAGATPLNWDGSWNGVTYPGATWNWTMCSRHTAERTVQISNLFRSVFGDSAMMTRIRPVLMSQLGYPGFTLFDETTMMLDYYDNLTGNFSAIPHPPNYYLYGAGGSAYYSSATTASSLDAIFNDPGMTPAGFASGLQGDAALVTAMGLKRVAYEGGPSLDKTGGVRDAFSAQAVNDPRMTSAIINMHNAWSNNSGELLVYYVGTGDYQWGFTPDTYSLSTQKLLAIDALNASERAPLILGTQVPGVVAGNMPNLCSRGWGCNPIQTYDNFTADGSKIVWAGYSLYSTLSSPWTVNLYFTNAHNATVALYVDGSYIGTKIVSGTSLSFAAGTIPSGSHGIILRAVTGTFSLDSISVAQL
jgi:hypothetical protein